MTSGETLLSVRGPCLHYASAVGALLFLGRAKMENPCGPIPDMRSAATEMLALLPVILQYDFRVVQTVTVALLPTNQFR